MYITMKLYIISRAVSSQFDALGEIPIGNFDDIKN